jgi:hypothetical protein
MEIACDEDFHGSSGSWTSYIEVDLTEGQTVAVVIDAYGTDSTGDYYLDITDCGAGGDDAGSGDADADTDTDTDTGTGTDDAPAAGAACTAWSTDYIFGYPIPYPGVHDCDGVCISEGVGITAHWGDGVCDSNLDCASFWYDNGDCDGEEPPSEPEIGSMCGPGMAINCDGVCVSDFTGLYDEFCDLQFACDEWSMDGGACPGGCPLGFWLDGREYVEDCSGDGQCIAYERIRDGVCDSRSQPFGADLTCHLEEIYDCFGEDALSGGDDLGDVETCMVDHTTYGGSYAYCDTGWELYGYTCTELEAAGWNCDGCACDGDYLESAPGDGSSDDGDGPGDLEPSPGDWCDDGEVYDCILECVDADTAYSWVGDGYCDDGSYGMVLDCEAFDSDDGDCD